MIHTLEAFPEVLFGSGDIAESMERRYPIDLANISQNGGAILHMASAIILKRALKDGDDPKNYIEFLSDLKKVLSDLKSINERNKKKVAKKLG